jgi:VanZ family protein
LQLLLWRGAVLLWAAKIFWLSTESFAGTTTRPLLAKLLAAFHLTLSADAFWVLHLVCRKLAHVAEYGILSFLIYRSLGGNEEDGWRPHLAAWSVLAASAYSLTDEFHQSFVRGRGASLLDCSLDVLGAILPMLLIYAHARLSSNPVRRILRRGV